MPTSAYYLSPANRSALLKKHTQMLTLGLKILSARYGAEVAQKFVTETKVEFEQLIPEIPYIGGKDNSMTDTLEQMTTLLALYRVMNKAGKPVAEIGEVVHAMGQAWVDQYPRFVQKLIGRLLMSRWWRARARQKAALSQQRRYPGDFVTEVVEGNGEYEWGINYVECGVVKFFQAQDADEFTPYMCVIDFLLYPSARINLHRQGTLATGCAQCDFRFHPGPPQTTFADLRASIRK